MNNILTPEIQDIHEQIGDEHILTSIETPMLATAFDKSDIDILDGNGNFISGGTTTNRISEFSLFQGKTITEFGYKPQGIVNIFPQFGSFKNSYFFIGHSKPKIKKFGVPVITKSELLASGFN
jgi:hypothetical protein